MTINVSVSQKNLFPSVKVDQKDIKVNVVTKSGIIMARRLSDLLDVDTSNVQDNSVMMFDGVDQKYKFYDPDEILTTSVDGGLPANFLDYLNQNLNPQALIDAISSVYTFISTLTLGALANVDPSVDVLNQSKDRFILRYNDALGAYEIVDPDEILNSAVDEDGLPQVFIDYLNTNLIPQILQDQVDQLNEDLSTLTLGELFNVTEAGVLDKYLIMYDQTESRWKAVNPDEVFTAAVEESTQPGISTVFLDQLDVDLDNRIDVDAGTF
jgi:hypothetical protein